MARSKQLIETPELTPEQQLESLVPRFGEVKSQYDILDKQVKSDGNMIKSIMTGANMDNYEAGGYIAKVSVSQRESFEEDALIVKLKNLKESGDVTAAQLRKLIKKKEYVDMDELESAIYNNKLDAAELKSCQIIKEVVTLRLSKSKKED